MEVKVYTWWYEAEHWGKKPRGYGWWMFAKENGEKVFGGEGLYGDVKGSAVKFAKVAGLSKIYLMG